MHTTRMRLMIKITAEILSGSQQTRHLCMGKTATANHSGRTLRGCSGHGGSYRALRHNQSSGRTLKPYLEPLALPLSAHGEHSSCLLSLEKRPRLTRSRLLLTFPSRNLNISPYVALTPQSDLSPMTSGRRQTVAAESEPESAPELSASPSWPGSDVSFAPAAPLPRVVCR
jgi:hypothetical protein